MKIRPVGAELFHEDGSTGRPTDRRTDVPKLITAFRDFANAPKSHKLMLYRYKVTDCSEIHTKHINALCIQNAEFLFCTSCGT